jgi:glycolate oxidase iron-sulfur subunit
MQTRLADFVRDTADGTEAAAILGKCVHCGFCTATCPTYRVLGDELDGPRGRIYLMKRALEGVPPTARTQLHLDRCLTCRACETTCPSGVQYGRLLDVGRRVVDERVPRPAGSRLVRAALRATLTRPLLFATLVGLGQGLRPLLPGRVRAKLPQRAPTRAWPSARHERRVLLLAGCVQPGLAPNVNVATARVLDALGLQVLVPGGAGCCGAIRHHLGDPAGALDDARRNVDAWWPQVEAGAEAIVMNASGCGAHVREYAHLLRHDPAYAAKAARLVELTRDVVELVAPRLSELRLREVSPAPRIAFHPPCSLQHAQRIRGAVERVLERAGAVVVPFDDAHACCGSAGTYSLLHPDLADELRARKLDAIGRTSPDLILSANVGCIAHLGAAAGVPVRHWIEWLDEAIAR